MLLRFDPFRDLERAAAPGFRSPPPLPMEAVRRGRDVVVSFDLPGVDPSTIDLTVERDVLTVTAERPSTRREGDEVLAAERRYGTATRRILLGDALDTDRLEAQYEHGVLTVRIPAAEQARPRKVPVAVTSGPAPIPAEAHEADPALTAEGDATQAA